jgi:hypothetical protein
MKKKSLLVVLAVGLISLAAPVMVAAQGGQPPVQAPRLNEGTMINSGAALHGAQRGGWINDGLSLVDAIAIAANMETVDVVAALQDGATYEDLAPLDEILDVILDARAEALAQAVTDGRFTQEEVDAMLAQMKVDLLEQLNTPRTAQGTGNGLQLDGTQPLEGSGYRGNNSTQMKGRGRTDHSLSGSEDCPYVES